MITKNVYYFCKDDPSLIDGYIDVMMTDEIYVCHHRLGLKHSKEYLKNHDLYYHRPAEELVLLSKRDHAILHKQGKTGKQCPMTGRKLSDETRRKISKTTKGKGNPMYGKHHSEETRKKMSKSLKGKNKGKHRVYDANGKFHYVY